MRARQLRVGSVQQMPDLIHARVCRITGAGVVVTGIEIIARRDSTKSSVDRFPQTWWCLVFTEPVVMNLSEDYSGLMG